MTRQRRSPEEMEILRDAIYAVAETDRPVSVRHIFYRMVVLGLVEKSNNRGYPQVQKTTVDMRDTDALPYEAYWRKKQGQHFSRPRRRRKLLRKVSPGETLVPEVQDGIGVGRPDSKAVAQIHLHQLPIVV